MGIYHPHSADDFFESTNEFEKSIGKKIYQKTLMTVMNHSSMSPTTKQFSWHIKKEQALAQAN